jgi:hypothetical protein
MDSLLFRKPYRPVRRNPTRRRNHSQKRSAAERDSRAQGPAIQLTSPTLNLSTVLCLRFGGRGPSSCARSSNRRTERKSCNSGNLREAHMTKRSVTTYVRLSVVARFRRSSRRHSTQVWRLVLVACFVAAASMGAIEWGRFSSSVWQSVSPSRTTLSLSVCISLVLPRVGPGLGPVVARVARDELAGRNEPGDGVRRLSSKCKAELRC